MDYYSAIRNPTDRESTGAKPPHHGFPAESGFLMEGGFLMESLVEGFAGHSLAVRYTL
jgi:hypothetical protein